AEEEEAGKLTAVSEDEATVILALDETSLASADVVILSGSAASSRKAWSLMSATNVPVVDATRTLEDIPSARLRAPLSESASPGEGRPVVVAHPAAVTLANFFTELEAQSAVRQSIVTIFEPASERGQAGIDELHQQTVKLFNFQGLPTAIYGRQ